MTNKTDQLADVLRAAILAGELSPGGQVPGEFALMQQHGVSRYTVRAALDRLTQEGLIVIKGRTGRFVRSYTTITWDMTRADPETGQCFAVDAWASLTMEGAAGFMGHEEVNVRLLQGDRTVAGVPLRDLLHLGDDDMVVCRDHLRIIDGVPQQLAAVYIAMSVADADKTLMRAGEVDIDAALAALDLAHAGSTDTVSARQATPEEAQLLQLAPGTSVMDVLRIDRYGPGRRPLVARYEVYAGRTNRARYELPARPVPGGR